MSLQKTNLIDIYFQNQILSLERYLSRVVKIKRRRSVSGSFLTECQYKNLLMLQSEHRPTVS